MARRCPRRSSTPRRPCPGPSPTPRPPGTVLRAGNGQTLSVTFTPTDTADYTTATATATIDGDAGDACDHLGQSGEHRVWHGAVRDAARRHGERAGDLRLLAVRRTVLGAGTTALSVTFTPTDTTDYATATATTTIDVDDGRRRRSPGPTPAGSPTARRCPRRSSTPRPMCRALHLLSGRRHGAGSGDADPLGDLHTHRHDQLPDGDPEATIVVTQATPSDHVWANPASIV